MKKAPTATEITASARDKRQFTRRLLDSLNDSAHRLIEHATGGDFQKLLNLLAVTSFAAGASFALALVGAFK